MTAAAATQDRLAADSAAAASLTGRVAAICLAAAAIFGIVAAFGLRPLYADGFYYLLRLLESGDLRGAPARLTVEVIRQWPLLAADALGIGDLHTLAVMFGAVVQILPLAITALAWLPLPADRKWLFVLPLLHVAAGTMASAFMPITEGATAAAYFWLLLFAVMFAPLRGVWALVIGTLAAGTILLHEAMAFLGPVLAAAAWLRARGTAPRLRIALRLLAAWFAAVAALHLYFIVFPSHPANRASFFDALLRHYWAYGFEGSPNLPAMLGLGGIAAVTVIAVAQLVSRSRAAIWGGWWIVAALAAISAWEIGNAIAGGRLLAAAAQMNSRNHGLFLSLPLAVAALALAHRAAAPRPAVVAQVLATAAVLMAGALVWHAAALQRWNAYLGVFRQVLASHSGYVPFDAALAPLSPAERRLMRGMAHGWVEPSMSIVLAPGGNVRAIVGPWMTQGWQAFDARKPEELPRHRTWRFDAYLEALKGQQRRGEAKR